MMSSMVNPVFLGGFCGGLGGGASFFFIDKSLAIPLVLGPDVSITIFDGPGIGSLDWGGGGRSGGFNPAEGGIKTLCGTNCGARCAGGWWCILRLKGGVPLPPEAANGRSASRARFRKLPKKLGSAELPLVMVEGFGCGGAACRSLLICSCGWWWAGMGASEGSSCFSGISSSCPGSISGSSSSSSSSSSRSWRRSLRSCAGRMV